MTSEAGWYSSVHPVLRVVSFVIFSLFLALGNPGQLVAAVVAVVILFATTGHQSMEGLWPTLRRIRWLLLSILIIYAWMTPGPALFAGLEASSWLPTTTGLIQGGRRLLALVLIVAAVHWLLFVTSQHQLVSALYWLALPLRLLGISRQRFAVRVALILRRVLEVQALVGRQVKQAGIAKGDIRGYAKVSAVLVEEIMTRAEQAPCEAVEIAVSDRPPLWQWVWPLLLTVVLLLAGEAAKL